MKHKQIARSGYDSEDIDAYVPYAHITIYEQ